MRLSILVPVFNHEHYIDECIESLLTNSSRDFEVIVSDNHSTDRTMERLERYKGDERIKVVQPPSKLTPQQHHWYAFEKSSGEYIYFIGGDDYFLPGVIDECIALLDGTRTIIGPIEIFYDGCVNTRDVYNTPEALKIIGTGGTAFLKRYLAVLNRDDLAFAFVPRRLFGLGASLCGDTLETMLGWNAILTYFPGSPVSYFPRSIFRKRYRKVHPAGNFGAVAYRGSFSSKTLAALYNSFFCAIKFRSLAALFLLLFSNRRHKSGGGLLGLQRSGGYWFPGPVPMILMAPILDLLRLLKKSISSS